MMYTIYEKSNGRVQRVVSCSPAMLDAQFDVVNEQAIVGSYPDDGFYFDGGLPVKFTSQPSLFHIFDWSGKQWVDPRTLQSKIDGVRTAIKAERDQRKIGGALVNGKWFHSDGDSRIQQLALVVMGAGVPAIQWKTMDGSFVTMTQAIATGIFQATAVLDTTLFANAERHLAAVSASLDPETYDFSTGWPEHFQA